MEILWNILAWLYISVFIVLFLHATTLDHFGLHRRYINFILRLFAFGQVCVQLHRPQSDPEEVDSSTEDVDELALSMEHPQAPGVHEDNRGFHLDDVLGYMTAGMSAIVEDNVLKYFVPEELPVWNLLSRTNSRSYEFVSIQLTVCWVAGFLVRYFLLFPLRVIILLLGTVLLWVCMLFVSCFPSGRFKRWLYKKVLVFCSSVLAGSFSLVATFHNAENAPENGIAVANHTSPIDSLILCTHNSYDLVGQIHGGFMGFLLKPVSQASSHVWFERSDAKDRSKVAERLKKHADNPDLPPILIYPEGVCVNNTSVMQFKKGSFEIGSVIHPIAIRFDARFGDAFWWQGKFFYYWVYMMTSWAIVCNVWYLPPMTRRPSESAIAFASRVKAEIARQAGLVDVTWDGFLNWKPVKEEWLRLQQQEFAKHLQPHTTSAREKEEKCIRNTHISGTYFGTEESPAHLNVNPADEAEAAFYCRPASSKQKIWKEMSRMCITGVRSHTATPVPPGEDVSHHNQTGCKSKGESEKNKATCNEVTLAINGN